MDHPSHHPSPHKHSPSPVISSTGHSHHEDHPHVAHSSHKPLLVNLPVELVRYVMYHRSLIDNHNLTKVSRYFRDLPRITPIPLAMRGDLEARFSKLGWKGMPEIQLQLLNAHRAAWRQITSSKSYRTRTSTDKTFYNDVKPLTLKFAADSNLDFKEDKHYVEHQLHRFFDGVPSKRAAVVPHDLPSDEAAAHTVPRDLGICLDFSKIQPKPQSHTRGVREVEAHRHTWSPSEALQALQRSPLAKHLEFHYLDAAQPDVGSFEGQCLRYEWTSLPRLENFVKDVSNDVKYQSCVHHIKHIRIELLQPSDNTSRHSLEGLRLSALINLQSLVIGPNIPKLNWSSIDHPRSLKISALLLPESLLYVHFQRVDFADRVHLPPRLRTLSLHSVRFAHTHALALETLPICLFELRLEHCSNIVGDDLGHLTLLRAVTLVATPLSQTILTTLTASHLIDTSIFVCESSIQFPQRGLKDVSSVERLTLSECHLATPLYIPWVSLRELILLGTHLHSIPDLRSFSQLWKVQIDSANLQNEPDQFNRFPSYLKTLSLTNNLLVEVDLRPCKALYQASLNGNTTLDPRKLKLPESLLVLELNECDLVQLPVTDHLPKLEQLSIRRNPQLHIDERVRDLFKNRQCELVGGIDQTL